MTLVCREIVELYSGALPELHVQSECRCPPSHPRVHPLVERYGITTSSVFCILYYATDTFLDLTKVTVYRYCIPNAVQDTTNDRVLRLNINAHPLSYINDQDMGTTWLSKIMTPQELDEGLTITVDLANGLYQVMKIISDMNPNRHAHLSFSIIMSDMSKDKPLNQICLLSLYSNGFDKDKAVILFLFFCFQKEFFFFCCHFYFFLCLNTIILV